MPGPVAVTAQVCESWLVEQVARARLRTEVPPLTLTCPTPDVVEAVIDDPREPTASVSVRLSGFAAGDPWVGAALVSLVETREAARRSIGVPPVSPSPPPPPPPRPPPPPPARRVMLLPTIGLLGTTPQLGADARLDLGVATVGLGVARHSATDALGTVEAVDLMVAIGVPRPLARVGSLRVVLAPSLAGGVTRLRGIASEPSAIARTDLAATVRATLDAGVETSRASRISLAFGFRVGLRIAPAGQVDGRERLVGTGVMLGAYFGAGWAL